MFRKAVLLLVTALLTACGFHLRGFNDMPHWFNNLAIVIQDAHRDLGPMLRNQLEAYNINLVQDPAKAAYLLVIEGDGIQQQMTNVAASTAPRQYLLIYDVRFTLSKVRGETLVSSGQVFATRQLTINSNRILGSNSEEAQLMDEMRHEAVEQIINRISREVKKRERVKPVPSH
ncbi:MAG: LPS assembly lipoprotein LptE [Tatlockia sp.]|jgi:LPS-assembly lipoprotein